MKVANYFVRDYIRGNQTELVKPFHSIFYTAPAVARALWQNSAVAFLSCVAQGCSNSTSHFVTCSCPSNALIKIGSNSYEKVKIFKYLDSLLTNQNYIQEEIKCRLEAGNSCYYSVQTLLSSRLLCKNLKIKIYKIIILPVMLYGCETWSSTLRKECRLRYLKR